jgi:hypothetical protein
MEATLSNFLQILGEAKRPEVALFDRAKQGSSQLPA